MSLVFSVGFNGYDWIWRECLKSHETYARKHGYKHILIGEGETTPLAREGAWLKIPLMMAALDAGHEWVMFIDSDAEYDADCPRFETVAQEGCDIYLANGHSGRPNSGVFIVKNTPGARGFLLKVLGLAREKLSKEDDVSWGENGFVIHAAKTYEALGVLGTVWNNNQKPRLPSHVRHYSHGPMRRHYRREHDFEEEFYKIETIKHTEPAHALGSAGFYNALADLLAESARDPALFDISRVDLELRALAG